MESAFLSPQHVQGRVYSDRTELLRNTRIIDNPAIAEIGVAFGDGTKMLLDIFKPSEFHAFDLFKLHDVDVIWGQPTSALLKGKSHLDHYKSRVEIEFGYSNLTVHVGPSPRELASLKAQSLDLIYIDGDHTLEGVWQDTKECLRLIKPNGVLVFNDYIMRDSFDCSPFGIVPVVNDLCVNSGWTIVGLGLHPQMFCDVALRKL